ncbi:hypothetical protein DSCO28_16170 [Desulfosarcina ovata subsp. sediminis]|uniref:HTH marR-type domain-containing protein n=1 Tax=Desulfosarcina ovata subsp. sediminis TaxID=885957 RepID=A0A5K7ZJJ6_9BACT|nr:helix-turn-helix domain-containing protein [Desulfosarcina ovata]BBO81051.1 hypothetical protein DSCO28_16170 [Desulfosarcina ovata subsp. sediminis]
MKEEENIIEKAKYILLTSRAIIAYCKQEKRVRNRGDGTFINLQIFDFVKQHAPVGVHEIAEYLNVSKAYTSTMISELVERDLLVRKRNRNDKRKCTITIAPNAHKRIESMEAEILFPIDELVKNIGKAKTRKWIELLRQIESEIERLKGKDEYAITVDRIERTTMELPDSRN